MSAQKTFTEYARNATDGERAHLWHLIKFNRNLKRKV